jgi:uncharacterized membrane protein YedE/YeeE
MSNKTFHIKTGFLYLFCGALFGAGLTLSGMTDQNKVLGFLDLFGSWDPSLIFVMVGGIFVTFIGYKIIFKRSSPLWADAFMLPTSTIIDKNLVLGALLFGAGWGLYGYCPGPAIASLAQLHWETFLFVAAMIAGMFLQSKQAAYTANKAFNTL